MRSSGSYMIWYAGPMTATHNVHPRPAHTQYTLMILSNYASFMHKYTANGA